jgi:hypothetical protein
MVTRAAADGVIRTEPIETPIVRNSGGDAPARVAIEDFDWNKWLASWLDNEREEFIKTMGGVVATMRREYEEPLAAQAKRINELELKLAAAVDSLSRETVKSADAAEERRALEDKTHALEFRVARMDGVISVLRGRNVPGALAVKGTYRPSVVYHELDVVALNGGSFVARRDAPGPCPGDDWQLLASPGRRGERGLRGAQGLTGPAGRDGADAPVWRSVSFDPKKMAFQVRLSDGSLGPVISLGCIFSELGVDPATYSIKLVLLDGSELKFSLRGLFEQFFDELKGR